MADEQGVRMLDPATGAERWHYRRGEPRSPQPPDGGGAPGDVDLGVVSEGGRTVAVNVGPRTNVNEPARQGAATWVFDAVSGRLLADLPGRSAYAIVGDLVVTVTHRPGRITAFSVTGESRWERAFDGCQEQAVPRVLAGPRGTVLVEENCVGPVNHDEIAGRSWLWALDRGTGATRWLWRAPVSGLSRTWPVGDTRPDRVLVDVRPQGVLGAAHTVVAIDLQTGSPLWTRENLVLDPAPPVAGSPNRPRYQWDVGWARGTPVLVENTDTARFQDKVTVLAGLNPDTGATSWTHVQRDTWRANADVVGGVVRPVLLSLREGRLALAAVPLAADRSGIPLYSQLVLVPVEGDGRIAPVRPVVRAATGQWLTTQLAATPAGLVVTGRHAATREQVAVTLA
ncbi:PQQ-binding-like beta-propeller repeat protein [Amycolatopsis sp. NPDC059027]|uniref:outer membrane protein assembly factor BamB family protein n=1 Tax=Amycolatopsis sp. NPDC059027 TaxID=3346709 RepID=UPI003671D3E3